ncbi:hypothetical protein [uncultured Erythrobacter sp.]|uniref:hypothetical protein n=1 Tax=uncultured Erythrobacter sp. TaxID=263913 RepID=UPI00261C7C9D|nr:hypothetical protein [uncultured Erythrobacter sp.]
MDLETSETLPAELELALAYTPVPLRDRLRTYFALDQRLARIVAATTEPMLGQMRLAWWRDMLGSDPEKRPSGDAVLEAIGEHWRGREPALAKLVDGWEALVVAEQLGEEEIQSFAVGRGAPFLSLIDGSYTDIVESVSAAASRWSLADAASGVSDPAERARLTEAALRVSADTVRLPGELRGLSVLQALALRSLKRGGTPLMQGRRAALTAMRAAILGR